ncbi:hypothetical protein K438DRAFT_1758328 [Mycena galopus ATCC 62051]|nr:hypothetical protein K438DRAFT_1758328 [Mycena galopus ATCC 62051]
MYMQFGTVLNMSGYRTSEGFGEEYRIDATGLIDLHDRLMPGQGCPSCFLIEINARVPGPGWAFSTLHTYGVDFYAVLVLACVRDTARLGILATPFHFPGREDGSQYWCEAFIVQVERGGRYISEDACGDLVRRRPVLGEHIARGVALYAPGAIVPDPATGLCVVLA